MRLLQCRNTGEFSLTKDFLDGEAVPPYAILSHTWEDGQEVTYKDLMDVTGRSKSGYDKIQFCGQQAERDGLQYFWVDTCCIDKSNHVELQKAINSMFRWYGNAAKCYVYLSDVLIAKRKASDGVSVHLGASFSVKQMVRTGLDPPRAPWPNLGRIFLPRAEETWRQTIAKATNPRNHRNT